MASLEIQLLGEGPSGVDEALIPKLAAVISQEGLATQSGVINVKLVDDAEIKALNKRYSGQPHATDVLSFSYIETAAPVEGELGDIVVSLETAIRQAAQTGHDLGHELANLIVHGVLHILGYDHSTAGEQAKMDQLQQRILTKTDSSQGF